MLVFEEMCSFLGVIFAGKNCISYTTKNLWVAQM